jgi:hypothetical protein
MSQLFWDIVLIVPNIVKIVSIFFTKDGRSNARLDGLVIIKVAWNIRNYKYVWDVSLPIEQDLHSPPAEVAAGLP